jgi:GNAT superfamily N-acetyltransferase
LPAEPAAAARTFSIRQVPVEVVRPLRHLVLRPGRPPDTVRIPEDDSADTWHLAAIAGDDVVGVMTLFADTPPPAVPTPAERFRWMAVHPDWQGRGVGRSLLHEAASRLQRRGAAHMWAHGRDSAQPFYERNGFDVYGAAFVDPDTGISHHIIAAPVDRVLERTALRS